MRIVQVTPGAGDSFYCENCLRDKALTAALRRAGHDAMLVPLYLPLLGDQPDPHPPSPVFFGGVNVYLQQRFGLFRRTPRWVDRLFDSPRLLRWVSRHFGMTDARVLGETTLSMLRGEHGRQRKELERLVAFLGAGDGIDVVCLSNALLLGLVRRIKEALDVPVVCIGQDEDAFLDDLPEPFRRRAWQETRRRAEEVDCFVPVSRYYADVMRSRFALPDEKVRAVYPGVDFEGYAPAPAPPDPPAIGYLSMMSQSKGLDTLAEAFILLKRRPQFQAARLRVSGGSIAGDETFISEVRAALTAAGVDADVEFVSDFSREGKQEFLRTLSVVSVPTPRPEAFGLFVLESLACGVPLVLPRHGAFVELSEETQGCVLTEPNDPRALADALADLLGDERRRSELGARGRRAVCEEFTIDRAAREMADVFRAVTGRETT